MIATGLFSLVARFHAYLMVPLFFTTRLRSKNEMVNTRRAHRHTRSGVNMVTKNTLVKLGRSAHSAGPLDTIAGDNTSVHDITDLYNSVPLARKAFKELMP